MDEAGKQKKNGDDSPHRLGVQPPLIGWFFFQQSLRYIKMLPYQATKPWRPTPFYDMLFRMGQPRAFRQTKEATPIPDSPGIFRGRSTRRRGPAQSYRGDRLTGLSCDGRCRGRLN